MGFVVEMLKSPALEHCFHTEEPYAVYRSDKQKYNETAKLWTAKYAMPSPAESKP